MLTCLARDEKKSLLPATNASAASAPPLLPAAARVRVSGNGEQASKSGGGRPGRGVDKQSMGSPERWGRRPPDRAAEPRAPPRRAGSALLGWMDALRPVAGLLACSSSSPSAPRKISPFEKPSAMVKKVRAELQLEGQGTTVLTPAGMSSRTWTRFLLLGEFSGRRIINLLIWFRSWQGTSQKSKCISPPNIVIIRPRSFRQGLQYFVDYELRSL
ncbi:uncharacterized protein [Miscanthus floridulus]|uniref:uncharacterized protein isoform X5 n=1 Tax=Miscanthus floridulus TaxID=154761 RepID=UPI003458C8C7